MASKFRKKPVVIEAVQWHGGGSFDDGFAEWEQLKLFLRDPDLKGTAKFGPGATDEAKLRLWNKLEQQWINCPVGHWIIKGIRGEFYPCDPGVFGQTYERVE